MYKNYFAEFLASNDTLRVYKGNRLVFSSTKDRLLPLLEYLDSFAFQYQQIAIFDKIMGNAAALLSIKAGCREVYSPLGSELAVKTLEKYSVKCYLLKVIPYILQPGKDEICPMEKLSIGKTPEEFHQALKNMVNLPPSGS